MFVFFEASPPPFTGEWHVEPLAHAKSHLYLTFRSSLPTLTKGNPPFSHASPISQTNMNQQIRSLRYSPLDLSAPRPRDGIVRKRRTNKQIIQTFNTPGANLCNPALQIGREVRLASATAP
jgi:hypothetical protein